MMSLTLTAIVLWGVCEVLLITRNAFEVSTGQAESLRTAAGITDRVHNNAALGGRIVSISSTKEQFDMLMVIYADDWDENDHTCNVKWTDRYGMRSGVPIYELTWPWHMGYFFLSNSSASVPQGGDIFWLMRSDYETGTMNEIVTEGTDSVVWNRDKQMPRFSNCDAIRFEIPATQKTPILKTRIQTSFKAAGRVQTMEFTKYSSLRCVNPYYGSVP